MKRNLLFLLTVFSFSQIFAQGQIISKNLSLAGLVGYQTLYGSQTIDPTQTETLSDLATWRDSRNGKEYALVGLATPGAGSGVAMVNVTNPANPFRVKTIRRPGLDTDNTPADIQVYNNFAFIAQNTAPTYWVDLVAAVDDTVNSTAGYKSDITTGLYIHNLFVNKDQQLLFLSYFSAGQQIQVYDISGIPASNPVFKGGIPQVISGARSHDLYARKFGADSGRVFDASLRAITISEYKWANGTLSVGTPRAHQYNPHRSKNPSDFSDPTKVIPVANRIAHSTWLAAGDGYLFSNEEQFHGENSIPTWVDPNSIEYKRGNYLYVWDVDPIYVPADQNNFRHPISQVYEVREDSVNGKFASPPNAFFPELSSGEKANSIHNLASRGTTAADTLYVAYYTKGVRVLNATNPANMSEIAFYDTPGLGTYVFPVFNGPWGVDPFLPSANILASFRMDYTSLEKPAFSPALSQ